VARVQRYVDGVRTRMAERQARFQEQTDAVAEAKRSKGFNREAKIREASAAAQDTANQLDALQRQLVDAQTKLTAARRAWLVAIDAELADHHATTARDSQLRATRNQLVALVGPLRKRIVLPDTTFDPNADPEDLDQQAAAIRDTEVDLDLQVRGLERLAAEQAQVAELRKNHARAKEWDVREDNQAVRTAPRSNQTSGPVADSVPALSSPAADRGPTTTLTFEADVPVVLAGVIDDATLGALARARQYDDFADKAKLTRNARDEVQKKLEDLRRRRKAIEDQARKNRR
jgi:hypothetical protein